MSKIIKVKVIKEYIQLKDILPMDFETELKIKLSTEEQIIPAKQTYVINLRGIIVREAGYFPEQKIPAGNYEGFSFKGLNGKIYDDKTITAAIGGYKKINEIFEKI